MQLRGETHLRVYDPVRCQILGALSGHPSERLGRLHDGHRVGEPFEIQLEVALIGAGREPATELVGVGRGKTRVPLFGSELDDRGRAQPAVEVIVQEDLRRGLDELQRRSGAATAGRT